MPHLQTFGILLPVPITPKIFFYVLCFTHHALSSVGCGKQHANYLPKGMNTRVVGGVEAKEHSWPWLVLLNLQIVMEDGSPAVTTCGSDLIRVKDGVEQSDILVTAAHCVTRKGTKLRYGPDTVTAYAGQHQIDKPPAGLQKLKVAEIKIHESYDPEAAVNDIALIKLEKPVVFSDTIRPICLPDANEDIPVGKTCAAAGWGLTRDASSKLLTKSKVLLQLRAPAHSSADCTKYWQLNKYESEHMICAGPLDASADTCPGDSGGMLACRNGESWTLYGVTSFGNDCDKLEKDRPGVYTRVSAFRDWISKNMAKLSAL